MTTYVKKPVHRCPKCNGVVIWDNEDERGQCMACGEDIEQHPTLAR